MPKGKAKNHAKPKAPSKPKHQPHSGGMKTVTAPVAVGTDGSCDMVWKSTPDGGMAQGQEYVGQVVVPENEEVGSNLLEMYIAPAEFGGTRLSLKSQEFQKFRFEEVEFDFIPAIGSENAGSIILAYDRDIANPTPPASQQGLRQLMAFEGVKFGNIWSPHRARCPVKAAVKDWLWCNPEVGGDDRLSYQGQFYVASMVPTGLDAGVVLGSIIMRYKCHFSVQALNEELDGVEAIANSNEYINGNTDAFSAFQPAADPSFEGDTSFAPKLQGDGSWAVRVTEGLYRLVQWLSSPTVTAGSGVASFSNLSVTPLELLTGPNAPQATVDTLINSSGSLVAANLVPVRDSYISVPRGGGLLRSTMNLSSLAATCTSAYALVKLGTYIATTAGFLTSSRAKREATARKVAMRAAAYLEKDARFVTHVTERYLDEGKRQPKPVYASKREPGVCFDCDCGFRGVITAQNAAAIMLEHAACLKKSGPLRMASEIVVARDRCRYCGQDPPDHEGRNCPVRLRALATLDSSTQTAPAADTKGSSLPLRR